MSDANFFHFDEQSRLDRLVDGELSADEYNSLLKSLDEQPDGWRRCALAFLEAQAWGREINAVRADLDSPLVESSRPPAENTEPLATLAEKKNAAKNSVAFDRLKLFLAIAASFLIAFALGFFASDFAVHRSDALPAGAPQFVDASSTPVKSNTPAQIELSNNSLSPESITLVVDDGVGGSAQYIEVPITNLQQTDPRHLFPESSAPPPQWIQAFEKMGHRVQRQRHIIPVQLEDGRNIVLPIEQFQVVPVVETIIQ